MRHKPEYDEYWVKSHAPITFEEIQEHRQKLKGLNDIIDNVKKWRDKVIAHIDRDFRFTGKNISKEYRLQRQQLQEVIDALVEILNRYSAAYDSSTFLEKFVGEDDVQCVMDSIRFHIQERKKQLEALRR